VGPVAAETALNKMMVEIQITEPQTPEVGEVVVVGMPILVETAVQES
jgi:hypothetical protein